MQCPRCHKDLEGKPEFCYFCGYTLTDKDIPLPPGVQVVEERIDRQSFQGPGNPQKEAVMSRYQDAYRVAKTVDTVGGMVKIFGWVAAIVTFILAFSARDSAIVIGIFCAFVAWVFFFIIGTLLASVAQIQMASLDSAVYASTFLTDRDRAEIMSLPKSQTKSAKSL